MSGIHYEIDENNWVADEQFRENMRKLSKKLKESKTKKNEIHSNI